MKKSEPVGTKVYAPHQQVTGTILQNRKTMPDLAHNFDYVIELFFGDERHEWGFAANELKLASVK